MMTSSNGNIFRVPGHLCGEFTGPSEFPTQRPVTRSFGVFFDLRLNKRLNKQPWGWWFETQSRPLWRQCNVQITCDTHFRTADVCCYNVSENSDIDGSVQGCNISISNALGILQYGVKPSIYGEYSKLWSNKQTQATIIHVDRLITFKYSVGR